MSRYCRSNLVLMALLALAAVARAGWADAPATQPTTEPARTLVLIVVGHPGNAIFAKQYRDRMTRFYQYFRDKAQVPPASITVLSGDASCKEAMVAGLATAEKIAAALTAVGKMAHPQDQLILVLLGHGATGLDKCVLQTPGPDLDLRVVADALNHTSAGNQVVLNFTDNAGDAVALLAHGGRAVVADTAAGQVNATDFTEFFLQAIESGAPANGVKNDAVPLLTAFNWATVHNAQWIVRQRHDEAGWTVEGKESAELFKKLYPMASGDHSEYAGQFVDSPKSQIQPDPIIDVVPDPAHYDAWGGRRMITETPTLDDLGDGKGAAGISEKGFHPLAGALPTDQGFLARRIILGQPQLLPAPPVKDQ